MRIPGCAHEVERVPAFDDLRSGQTVYGWPCWSCGRGHWVVLNQLGESEAVGRYWSTTEAACGDDPVNTVTETCVAEGTIYRIVDPDAAVRTRAKARANRSL